MPSKVILIDIKVKYKNNIIKKDIIKLNKGKRYGSALISGRVEQIHAMVKITVRAKGKKQQTIKGLRIICHWVFKVNFITVPSVHSKAETLSLIPAKDNVSPSPPPSAEIYTVKAGILACDT